MQAHRVEMILERDGTITLDHIPFRAGEAVEVVILARPPLPSRPVNPYPLHGTDFRLDSPFMPIAEDDWEASR